MARSMPMFTETAARTIHRTKRRKETMYTVRRPECSEKTDHHWGQNARLRLVWRLDAVSLDEATLHALFERWPSCLLADFGLLRTYGRGYFHSEGILVS